MRVEALEKIAAEYAKDIVVANAQHLDLIPNAENGKNVADFYEQIFKGISETLKNSSLNY